MSSQMPELGAKISLISKADIRYEGRLFQVDPQECTIALANVRSFGTEERETHYPVPAQSQVYEYILFRGSDIKDIRIVQTALPQDPAIVQLVSHQQPQQQQPSFQSHPVLGQSSHPLGGFGYGVGMGLQRAPGPGPLMMQQPSELGHVLRPRNDSLPGPSVLDHEPDLIGGVSRSTTPSLSRKSPTMDQGTQVNKSLSSPPRDNHPKPIQPPDREHRGRRDPQQLYQPGQSGQGQGQGQGGYRRQDRQQQQQQDGIDTRRPFHENNRVDYVRNDNYQRRPNYRRDNRDGQPEHFQNNYQNQQNRDGQQGGWVPRNNYQQHQQQMRGDGIPRQHQNNNNNNMAPRGNRGPRGPGRQQMNRGAPGANKKTLKFDDDYDFDKANTEFEELRSQLNKLKVSGEPAAEPKGELEKKEDSGNETGTGEPEAGDDEVFYDKKKSFFDSISCEAVERSKGRSQRTDWRVERKLNTETFGVSSSRRGMYRGRGYYAGGRNYGYRPRNNNQQGGPDSQAPSAAPAPPAPLQDSQTLKTVVDDSLTSATTTTSAATVASAETPVVEVSS